MANVEWDTKDFLKGLARLEAAMNKAADGAVMRVADEVLRLSAFEVPHDIGLLQGSASNEPGGEHERIVGYNKVYAARLHEHPEYRFQKGRKGKYLEDPMKNNLRVFKGYIEDAVSNIQ